ncbi:spheroidene monooxygenase [Roseovarius rhodophyticola]|uniref:Spheroidene monooxygenase n=1 Tax=Roseovarius rhodophyticola TaxID=3080827 RepID=A0ABZ2TGY3_9RHOB|nr:spheroidene monooxygenase [Roseovarius sp. W115]MDV2931092.1 spheroidene monooxygenase [Roseovarius sp. W115]
MRNSAIQTVSLSFFRFPRGAARLWAFAMMGLARPSLRRVPDIGFWKLCGSGTGEGFTPIPNTGVYAILATWPNLKVAQERTDSEYIFKRYQAKSEENYTLFMSTLSARGIWSGAAPFDSNPVSDTGPIAALTRATISPLAALSFWRRVPDISSVIGQDPNVAFKIGIGEIPLLHQITFSVWPDTHVMANFARKDGPHARAIKAVRDGNWFREELYARFRILDSRGTWHGRDPLEHLRHAA